MNETAAWLLLVAVLLNSGTTLILSATVGRMRKRLDLLETTIIDRLMVTNITVENWNSED